MVFFQMHVMNWKLNSRIYSYVFKHSFIFMFKRKISASENTLLLWQVCQTCLVCWSLALDSSRRPAAGDKQARAPGPGEAAGPASLRPGPGGRGGPPSHCRPGPQGWWGPGRGTWGSRIAPGPTSHTAGTCAALTGLGGLGGPHPGQKAWGD